jgi:dihydrofolate synthase / folylpolyglutamate synthase
MHALPQRLATRADLDRLLALTRNFEQAMPAGPESFDLARMARLLAALGEPQVGPRTVHVAGSKGKGSTVRMVAAGLAAAGRTPVGLYTSPHLSDLAERIVVDGVPVDDALLLASASRVLPWLRAAHGSPDAPTFFEVLTAVAWIAFRERGCSDVVLETGLGGRLDATTLCRPAVTAITTIEREHVQILGDTVERIAAEKAGILKTGVPCVTATEGPALAVIEARARALQVPLEVLGRDLLLERVTPHPGPRTDARVRRGAETVDLALPLAGVHQARNAAVAFALLRRLGVGRDDARRGLAGVRLPAALEPFPGTPLVVLDGAHTASSARAAREALAGAWPGRRHVLLIALLAEKDVDAILAALVPGALAVVTTAVASPRALSAADLAARAERHGSAPVEAVPDPRAALARARALTPPEALLLVTGSLYLAGALRPALAASASPPSTRGS